MISTGRWLTAVVVWLLAAARLFAGGSGLNVVVIANADSTNSLQLANYYCEKRQVPPQNLLYINWPGTNVEWSLTDYQNTLLTPLLAMLSSRGLTNQIDYVVLSMDIPYRINAGVDGWNGTTSALYYGFMSDTNDPNDCPLANGSASQYAGSEAVFRQTPPINSSSNSFLVTMITQYNLALAEQIVDQGVASDGTFPTQTVTLLKTSDTARNVRYVFFDNVIFDTRIEGNYRVTRINSVFVSDLGESLGFADGEADFTVSPTTFAPGAMADSLTSFAGQLFESSGQTSELPILQAGATGSYGTVIEPCNYLQKFPNTQNYFYQDRGFSLAESYYMSVTNPYEGVIVAEPLAAPFAMPGNGAWTGLTNGSVLSGVTNLSVQFTAADAAHPVSQVDLFVDGTFFETLTNVLPSPGNTLYLTVNGHTTNYVVLPGATLGSVASGLAARLNRHAYQGVSGIEATAHGDRLELQSTNLNLAGSQMSISASNNIGTAASLTTFARVSQPGFLDTVASGLQSMAIVGTPEIGDVLTLSVTKTNGVNVTVSVTNSLNGDTVTDVASQLVNALNATLALQGPDGMFGEDVLDAGAATTQFNLQAQSPGLAAAQLQMTLTASNPGYQIMPAGTVNLDGNLSDLLPRNHLYVTAGATNLPCPFALNTTALADGWHELTAVGYEGSNVRTEKRVAQKVLVRNMGLSAILNFVAGGTNTALESTLQLGVTADTNDIASIQLFGTGGSWGVVSGQSNAIFSIAATNLQPGLVCFYAVVTDVHGNQYRTDNQPVRIIGAEPPFALTMTGSSPVLSWPATAGRLYNVLSGVGPTNGYQFRGSLTPTSTLGIWPETNPLSGQQFYRVETGQ